MTKPTSPAVRALMDQAGVAARDGTEILTALAGQLDAAITDGVAPDGPVAELLRGFTHRYLAGDIGLCPHLSRSAQPSWWLPARPGRLRCLNCARNTTRTISRRRDRCDRCRRVRHPLQAGVVLTPPLVVEDVTGGSATAVGPVAVIFQLCRDCQATTDAPPPADLNVAPE
jgi:hypothetical protein